MSSTFDVRVWSTEIYRGARGTTYTVRWKVGSRRWKERFATSALADGFRSDLVTATRKGEAFSTESGLPLSAGRKAEDVPWLAFACDYVDLKWGPAAATYRRSIAEAMTAVSVGLTEPGGRDRPGDVVVRTALRAWAFNTIRRESPDCPNDVRAALRWLHRNSLPVARLAEPAVLRRVLVVISKRIDGTPAAASVISKRRRVLFNAIEYAVELKHLDANPLPVFKWKTPKPATGIDRRSVVNPVQARVLLDAMPRSVSRSCR